MNKTSSIAFRLLCIQAATATAFGIAALIHTAASIQERLDGRLIGLSKTLLVPVPVDLKVSGLPAPLVSMLQDPLIAQRAKGVLAEAALRHAVDSAVEFGIEQPRVLLQVIDTAGRLYASSGEDGSAPLIPHDQTFPPSPRLNAEVAAEAARQEWRGNGSATTRALPPDSRGKPANDPPALTHQVPIAMNEATKASRGDSLEIRDVVENGQAWRVLRQRSGLGWETQIAEPLAWRRQAMLVSLHRPLTQAAAMLAVFMLLSWITARIAFSPVRALAAEVARRHSHELEPLQPPRNYAETVPLVQEVNRLMQRMRQLIAGERDRLADATHQLLTPLAALEPQVFALANATTPLRRAEASRELSAGIQRASSLVRQLLLLARAGGSEDLLSPVEKDLVPLIQAQLAAFAPRAFESGIDLQLDAPKALVGLIHEDLLQAAFEIILDNAIRHSGGDRLHVRAGVQQQWMEVTFLDNGLGVPPQYADLIGNRHFRVPGTQGVGNGLGLAIVARVVKIHDGTVSFGPGIDGRGLQVALRWPQEPHAAKKQVSFGVQVSSQSPY
ncbi:ATP-binding protein [Roseateles sp. NT4]|uniref:ATP-binding protein n=1 Tax=Roseateles sp. NT4 TaxID=3453715 RepID=UPI003EEE6265